MGLQPAIPDSDVGLELERFPRIVLLRVSQCLSHAAQNHEWQQHGLPQGTCTLGGGLGPASQLYVRHPPGGVLHLQGIFDTQSLLVGDQPGLLPGQHFLYVCPLHGGQLAGRIDIEMVATVRIRRL